MVDKFISVFTTIFLVTALGIAMRPGAQTAKVITAHGSTVLPNRSVQHSGLSEVTEYA